MEDGKTPVFSHLAFAISHQAAPFSAACYSAPRDGMLSALATVMPTREVSRTPRPFWSDGARALAESVLAFAIILAALAMVTNWPPWTYVLLWFVTCFLWPSKPVLWKRRL